MRKKLMVLFALLILTSTAVYPCSTIIVGKKASTDGTVLF